MHPHRLRFGIFSDQNPFMRPVKALAERVRANRKPVSPDNPLLAMEKAASSWITTWLAELGRGPRQHDGSGLPEHVWIAAAAGDGRARREPNATPRRIERDLVREAAAAELRSELDHRFEEGGLEEAVLRALIYVRLPDGAVDERGFQYAQEHPRARKSPTNASACLSSRKC